MKLWAVLVIAALLATTGYALPPPQPGNKPGRPVMRECRIRTRQTRWSFAYLRRNACNNSRPLDTLYEGQLVYDQGVPARYGCGYYYTRVQVPTVSGPWGPKIGWVASVFLDCDLAYPPPAVLGASTQDA